MLLPVRQRLAKRSHPHLIRQSARQQPERFQTVEEPGKHGADALHGKSNRRRRAHRLTPFLLAMLKIFMRHAAQHR
jgi:hypothetical protein